MKNDDENPMTTQPSSAVTVSDERLAEIAEAPTDYGITMHEISGMAVELAALRSAPASTPEYTGESRYHFTDATPFVVITGEGERPLGAGWLAITEAEYAKLSAAPAPEWQGMESARDVIAERRRQIEAEGWTPEHDDAHKDGSLADAAACYAAAAELPIEQRSYGNRDWGVVPKLFPRSWGYNWWKPSKDRRRNLVKAAALILAEIDRLDRLAPKGADE